MVIVSFNIHASRAYVTTGLISEKYISSFAFLDMSFLWNIFLFAKKYLESTVNRDNSIEGEIKERIALGKKAFFKKGKAVQLQAWAGLEGS